MLSSVYMECHETENVNGRIIQHNKFYELADNNDGTLTARFGKLDKTGMPTAGTKKQYPISKWHSIILKRKQHGYIKVDKTKTHSITHQLKKIEILLENMHTSSNFSMRSIRNKFKEDVIKKQLKLKSGILLTKEDMIYLNDIYDKVIKAQKEI